MSKKIMRKMKLLLVLFFFLALGMFNKAGAFEISQTEDKTEDRFIVHPAKIDFEIQPGEKAEFNLIVANRLGREEEFFIKKQQYGRPDLPMINPDWVLPETESFFLRNGERMKMKVQISVPENVDLGGYYLALAVGVAGEGSLSDKESRLKLISQIEIPLLGKVGKEDREEKFSLAFKPEKFFFLTGPIDFETRIINEGKVHFSARGELAVSNLLGFKTVQTPFATGTILPGGEEIVRTSWDKKFPIGLYRAKLDVWSDAGGHVQSEKKFLVFPLHLLILIIGIIWGIGRGMKKIKRRYRISFIVEKRQEK